MKDKQAVLGNLAIFSILSLAACTTAPKHESIPIVWHRLEGATTVFIKGQPVAVKGFAKIREGVCHVYAPDSPVQVVDGKRVYKYDQWATLGHEVKHCFDGSFHD